MAERVSHEQNPQHRHHHRRRDFSRSDTSSSVHDVNVNSHRRRHPFNERHPTINKRTDDSTIQIKKRHSYTDDESSEGSHGYKDSIRYRKENMYSNNGQAVKREHLDEKRIDHLVKQESDGSVTTSDHGGWKSIETSKRKNGRDDSRCAPVKEEHRRHHHHHRRQQDSRSRQYEDSNSSRCGVKPSKPEARQTGRSKNTYTDRQSSRPYDSRDTSRDDSRATLRRRQPDRSHFVVSQTDKLRHQDRRHNADDDHRDIRSHQNDHRSSSSSYRSPPRNHRSSHHHHHHHHHHRSSNSTSGSNLSSSFSSSSSSTVWQHLHGRSRGDAYTLGNNSRCKEEASSTSRHGRRRKHIHGRRVGSVSSQQSSSSSSTSSSTTSFGDRQPVKTAAMLLKASETEKGSANRAPARMVFLPRITFSVNYKSIKNAGHVVYVCGNIPEMGGSAKPSIAMDNGIPMELDAGGHCFKDCWESAPIEMRSRGPGTKVEYSYYVLRFKNEDEPPLHMNPSTRNNKEVKRHTRTILVDQENLVTARNKSQGGARSFIVPAPAVKPNLSHADKLKKCDYSQADCLFGDLSQQRRLRLRHLEDDSPSDASLGF